MAQGGFDCPICLDFYSEHPANDYFLSTDCGEYNGQKVGHVFHFQCILNSVYADDEDHEMRRCPICRVNIDPSKFTRLHGIEVQPKPDINVFDHELKIVVLGEFATGKSNIVKRFVRNTFESRHIETPGIDFFAKSVHMGDKRIKLNLWDTGGQEKYESLVSSYVRNAFGIIFVYDISNRASFDKMMDWIHFADHNGPLNTRRVLVGNKVDLDNIRQVSALEAQELARRLDYSFVECSAKECINIHEIFRTITVEMLNVERILEEAAEVTRRVQLQEQLEKLPRLERLRLAADCC